MLPLKGECCFAAAEKRKYAGNRTGRTGRWVDPNTDSGVNYFIFVSISLHTVRRTSSDCLYGEKLYRGAKQASFCCTNLSFGCFCIFGRWSLGMSDLLRVQVFQASVTLRWLT